MYMCIYIFIYIYLYTYQVADSHGIFPPIPSPTQAHTFGRILRLLVKVASRCGPKALLSPMVARCGAASELWVVARGAEIGTPRWKP